MLSVETTNANFIVVGLSRHCSNLWYTELAANTLICKVQHNIYNNIAWLVIFEGWFYSHTFKTLRWPHHCTKKGGVGPQNQFNPATFYWNVCTKPGKWTFMYLCVRSIYLFSFYDFFIGLWKWSDSVVFLFFIFIMHVINQEWLKLTNT